MKIDKVVELVIQRERTTKGCLWWGAGWVLTCAVAGAWTVIIPIVCVAAALYAIYECDRTIKDIDRQLRDLGCLCVL